MVSAFTGTNSSSEVLKRLGIHMEDLLTSDPNKEARRFREQNCLEGSCSFQCVRELNEKGMGWCWRCLSARCSLPSTKPDLAVQGFPCRPYSKARTGFHESGNVERHEDFDLAAHAREFVRKTRPLLALFENVVGFEPWLDAFCHDLEAEGYHVGSRTLALTPWVDASSPRIFILAIDGRSAPRAALTAALELVDALQAGRSEEPRVPVQDALLVPGTFLWEEHVQPILAARPIAAGAAQRVDAVWAHEGQALRSFWGQQGFEHHDARFLTEVSLNRPLLRGLGRSLRNVELLELGYLWASQELGLSPMSEMDRPLIVTNLFVDVSQNPSRKPWSFGLRRLRPNSVIYSYEDDRVLSAFEAFRIYGWQNPCLEGQSNRIAWNLIGNSMALQTTAVCISGLVFGSGLHVPGLWEG